VVGMALLPERPCSLRPRSRAFDGAVVLESFLKGLARGICVFGLIVLTLAVAPDYPDVRLRRSVAPSMGFAVAVVYLFTGLILLRKAHFWAGRAGPIQRLVTHARGRAYGFLAAIPWQLGIIIALLFAK
jgi:hypothetical protein